MSGDDAVRRAGRGRCGTRRAEGQERDPADGDLADPAGEVRYWLRIADGGASAGLGDAGDAEVTIRQTYETSTQVNKGELDGQKAFMQGKSRSAARC